MSYHQVMREFIINNNTFLCYPPNYNITKKDWNYIYICYFDNGIEYACGSNTKIEHINDIIIMLKNEYKFISELEESNKLKYLKQYNYNWIKKECDVLFNYYKYNSNKILEIIEGY